MSAPEHEDSSGFESDSHWMVMAAADQDNPNPFLDAQRAKVMGSLFRQTATPERFGRYVVLDTLGQGGMGIVLRAFDLQLNRPVAIKLLHDHLGEAHTARLRREAQAMAKLSHPNVVQVYEVGQVQGQTFVAMELVEGKTPKEWIQQDPRPGWRACVKMFIQLGEGLAAAHEHGLVHRDFKPGNAIIDDKGRARVLDFGLARHGNEDKGDGNGETGSATVLVQRARTDEQVVALELSLTKTGTVLGTPAYMPPEQMMGKEADVRSDQFSFCVSLYEVLYGERPYAGSSLPALMIAMREGRVRPTPKGSKVPAALRKVVQRGLAVEPEQRWGSMTELLEELRRVVAPPARRWVAGGGLGLAALAAFMVWQQRGELDDKDAQLNKQEHVITQSKEELAQRVVDLEQAKRRSNERLYAQMGMRATMLAKDPGHELEAVRVAVEAFDGLDTKAGPVPPPVFEGLTHALAGIDRGIALRGHEDRVVAVAVSPDGQHIATASKDTTVQLWDANTGAAMQTLEGHEGPVHALAWSPDGGRLATACGDGNARIWDATTGDELELLPHQGSVLDVAFSPDGRTLATASSDTAWVWHRGGDAIVVPLVGHTGPVRSLAWSPGGAQLVTASEDQTARVWNADTGVIVQTLEGHKGPIYDVMVSRDGTHIATASRDETARLWDATTGNETTSFDHGEVVYAVAFSPDGTQLATGTFDGGTARVWDIGTGHRIDTFHHEDAVVDVAFSPRGDQLVTASWDRTARSWNLDRGHALMTLPHPRRVDAVALSPDGTRLATGSGDGSVRLWDAESGVHLATLQGHRIDVLAVAFSADRSRLASASWDGTTRLWDSCSGAHLATLRGHEHPVRAVAWSADGTRVVTGGRDGTARMWDTATGQHVASVSHGGPIVDVAFTPDGRRLLTLGADDSPRVWDADSGKALSGLPREGPMTAVGFSVDGTLVAVATKDSVVHVQHADSRETVATFPGHSAAVRSMVFSPDGTHLATAGEDGTARVWDLDTKEPRATFPHEGSVLDVAWSPDGRHLATASGDQGARLWALEPRDWLTWGCSVLEGREAHEDATREACARMTHEVTEPASTTGEPMVTTAEDVEVPEVKTVHGVELVLIPGGTFTMGSPPRERGRYDNEGPQHEVTLDSFYLARTEVTNAQYALYLEANPDAPKPGAWEDERYNQPNQPIIALRWHEAKAYCDWAGLSLPTEAQWEYAVRAGTNTVYWFGNEAADLERFEWFDANTGAMERGNDFAQARPVATRGANPWGLYDTHGNLREWVLDAFEPYTTNVRSGDGLRKQPVGVVNRVVRGGGWLDTARYSRAAFRSHFPVTYRDAFIGFRPALRPRKAVKSSG